MKNKTIIVLFFLIGFEINGSVAQNNALSTAQIEEINKLVEELSQKDKFSGTVLITKAETIVYSKAIGMANREQNAAINLDTKFNLGSMNKMFTGIAIAQLVEQKKLRFSDKLIKILPKLPKSIYSNITIHQLLTHTSGTGDIFRNPRFWETKDTAKNISTYVNIGIDDPLGSKPGSKFEYSNYGFILLGAVIEKLSGINYYDYVKKNIFEKAGMHNTDSYESDKPNNNLAIGYALPPQMMTQKPTDSVKQILRKPNTKIIEVKGTSAGGGYSTANDLHLFSLALLSGKLISKESLETITKGKVIVPPPPMPANMPKNVPPLPQRKYGYGIGESFINNVRVIGHNGGAPGVDAHFYIYPTLGYTVVVLANYDRAGVPILNFIQNKITKHEK